MNIQEFIEFYPNHTRKEIVEKFGITLAQIDKLRKQLDLPLKSKVYKNLTLDFSDEQLEILIGSMLGDGNLRKIKGKGNSNFNEVHSLEQIEYLQWKYEKLLPFSIWFGSQVLDGRKNLAGKIVKDITKKTISCRLQTCYHPFLTELEKKWYLRDNNGEYVFKNKKRIKIIPKDLNLTPKIIGIWFFDDGSNNAKNRQACFNTQSYTFDECEFLKQKLTSGFGINCGVYKNGNGFVIQTKSSSYLDLIEIVKKHAPFCECMSYKTDLTNYKSPNFSTRFKKKCQNNKN